jgi:hypothetical protein
MLLSLHGPGPMATQNVDGRRLIWLIGQPLISDTSLMSLDYDRIALKLLQRGQTPGSIRALCLLISPLLLILLGITFTYLITYILAFVLIAFGIYHEVACYPTLYILMLTGFVVGALATWRLWQIVQKLAKSMATSKRDSVG